MVFIVVRSRAARRSSLSFRKTLTLLCVPMPQVQNPPWVLTERLVLGLSAWCQRFRRLHGALHLLGARLRSTSTKLYATVLLRHGNWTNLHRGNPPLFQAELAGRFRTDIDHPVPDSWPAILDCHGCRLPRFQIGHLGRGAERQRLAGRDIVVRVHLAAVRHLVPGEFWRIVGLAHLGGQFAGLAIYISVTIFWECSCS